MMTYEVLDNMDDPNERFDPNTRVVTIKYFYFESKAHLYAARLKEANIKSFISNANTSTALPLGEGGIGLHVREKDREEALRIVRELDYYNRTDPRDQSFHDADKEDIAYEKALHEQAARQYKPATMIILFLVLLILLVFVRAYFMTVSAGDWLDVF
ncbi:MAG: DUF2007 domain-containing protein [Bacteroidota bacterium]